MATTLKLLGTPELNSNANSAMYTVPAATTGIVKQIIIANVTGAAATARLFHGVGGASYTTADAIAYDITIPPNRLLTIDAFIVLATTDVLGVYAGTASALTFRAYGSEQT